MQGSVNKVASPLKYIVKKHANEKSTLVSGLQIPSYTYCRKSGNQAGIFAYVNQT